LQRFGFEFERCPVLFFDAESTIRSEAIYQSVQCHIPEDNTLSSVSMVINVQLDIRLRSSVFWDITPCSPLKVNQNFGGTCRLHLQGRKISQARNQRDAGSKQDQYVYLNLAYVGIISFKAVLIEKCLVKIRMSDDTKSALIFSLFTYEYQSMSRSNHRDVGTDGSASYLRRNEQGELRVKRSLKCSAK
jgi:hypothetical protein